MEQRSIEAIIRVLNDADVRYLIVGGLAVVAHGYVRYTADFDLILDMEDQNVRRALTALATQGYQPLAPVPLEHFADAQRRMQWLHDKRLTVFALFSAVHPATEVDLFVEPPLDFEKAYAAAIRLEVASGVSATFVSLDDLILLKRKAGRPKDLEDIEQLHAARREEGDA